MGVVGETLGRVDGLFLGAVATPWPGKAPSAIAKTPAPGGAATLGETGFEGDAQADLSVHGGPDKAVHHYPTGHYAAWATELPEHAGAFRPGGFGENIAGAGFDEASAHLGDVYRIGTAELQVSQGRQPCWKLDAHTGVTGLGARFRKTARTGWYFRVLTPGRVAVGDAVTLVARPQPDWPLRRAAAVFFDPRSEAADVAALAGLPELAAAWAAALQKRL